MAYAPAGPALLLGGWGLIYRPLCLRCRKYGGAARWGGMVKQSLASARGANYTPPSAVPHNPAFDAIDEKTELTRDQVCPTTIIVSLPWQENPYLVELRRVVLLPALHMAAVTARKHHICTLFPCRT